MIDEEYLIDSTGFLPSHKVRPGRLLTDRYKHVDEMCNAQEFIEGIGLDIHSLRENSNDPPDAVYLLEQRRIALELTICGHYTPEKGWYDRFWEREQFLQHLRETIANKSQHKPLVEVSIAFDEVWLFISAVGSNFTKFYIDDLLQGQFFSSNLFTQIWLQLEYHPDLKGGHRPTYRLK